MSRYFDETNKAMRWTESVSEKLQVQDLLNAIEGTEQIAAAKAKPSSKDSRKLTLPVPQDIPLLTRRDERLARAAESYRTIRTRLLRIGASREMRSFVFSSATPGEGKTLTSVNLALCCTQLSELRVLVVDADLRTHGLSHLLGMVKGPGLSEMLAEDISFEEAVYTTDVPNLSFVPGGENASSPAELFASPRWKEFMSWAADTFGVVLVDAPPILPLTDFELISAGCDGIIFVIRRAHASREAIRRARAHIDQQKLLGCVFNVSEEGSNENYHRYSGYGAVSPVSN